MKGKVGGHNVVCLGWQQRDVCCYERVVPVATNEWYLTPFPGNNNNNLLNQYEPAIGHHTYIQ